MLSIDNCNYSGTMPNKNINKINVLKSKTILICWRIVFFLIIVSILIVQNTTYGFFIYLPQYVVPE